MHILMAKVLTTHSAEQMILLESGLADRTITTPKSQQLQLALLELIQQGLFATDGGSWSLTDRGRIIARGIQRQGQIASGVRL